MANQKIFISHTTKDDPFVRELRRALEGLKLETWVDSRESRAGDQLAPEVEKAITEARQFIVVLSPDTVNSAWVRREVQKALQVEKERQAEGYRVIPILLPGIETSALGLWFPEEPLAVPVRLTAGGLSAALPAILAALGERLPDDYQAMKTISASPIAELLLRLSEPKIVDQEGKRRVSAKAALIYFPADPHAREVESRPFVFNAPLGPIEADDLRWYLEQYYLWPTGVFRKRAEGIEAQLPFWGQLLYQEVTPVVATREVLSAWEKVSDEVERRVSVQVDSELALGASRDDQAAAWEAGGALLALPWELLHDGRSYLFQGKNGVVIRRRLPNRHFQEAAKIGLPIRILLVSPRPEGEHTNYLNHRSSALPLMEAVEGLGDLVKLTILTPPTFLDLEKALQRADQAGEQFTVIHFDGHGIYDRNRGLGALCFEDPKDVDKISDRGMELVHAEKLAALFRDYRIPLVFLDACQTAKVEEDPTASVAAKLLEEGVTSVVAMSHSVLVTAATGFVKAFYEELAQGARVGGALLAGRRELAGNDFRGKIMGAGELRLQDWLVPVLYQEEQDPCLITNLPSEDSRRIQEKTYGFSLGELPPPPAHEFIGRSRELLALERLLANHFFAVVRGTGGAGKTTLAVELARWMARTERFGRVAFVSMEVYSDARGMLDCLGRQLLPEGEKWSVAGYSSLKEALQPVERALNGQATLIVIDNMESILPEDKQKVAPEVEEILGLCRALLKADSKTRLLFTSREALPEPFQHPNHMVTIGPLAREDAIQLVSAVLREQGIAPKVEDSGETPQEIRDLVDAVHCHARALVLLTKEVCTKGVRATTEDLRKIMAEMDRNHPGEREKSLYASMELSLRRLPPEMREKIKPLGVFQGGANVGLVGLVLEIEGEEAEKVARALVEVGLAESMGHSYYRFDPGLAPYLWEKMSEEEKAGARGRWDEAMDAMVGYLCQKRSTNTEIAAWLTRLELSNLIGWLNWVKDQRTPDEIIGITERVEGLVSCLGYSRFLAQTIEIREIAERNLGGEWSHARFIAVSAGIDRLIEKGDLQKAYEIAGQLLKSCIGAGEKAYEGAAYDIAMAYARFGRVLNEAGSATKALAPLAEARRRFQILVAGGITSAEQMVSATITEAADCLSALGRLNEAAALYEESIRLDENRSATRDVAANKFQLATVRLCQKEYNEALKMYIEARDIFVELGEPGSVATAWHQIGMVHREAGNYELAEQAYRQSLAIKVKQKDQAGEASTLIELGNLYNEMGRYEEAITFYRQAGDIYVKLQDQFNEGLVQGNLASTLVTLQQYDEARQELLWAIECNKPFGHAATPWKTWVILCELEQKTGNPQAAIEARKKARQCYLEYRRDGGESQYPGGKFCGLVEQAIREGKFEEAKQGLDEFLKLDHESPLKILASKLLAVLAGERDPELAEDPDLYYADAVELQLLLERLAKEPPAGEKGVRGLIKRLGRKRTHPPELRT